MDKRKVKLLGLTGIVIVAAVLAAGWWRGADEKGGLVLELAGGEGGVRIGEEREIGLVLRAGDELISGINLVMRVDQKYLEIREVEVNEQIFNSVLKDEVIDGGASLFISAVNMKRNEELPKGDLEVAKIKLAGKAKGRTRVELLPETYAVRYNPNNEADNRLELNLKNGEVTVE